MATATVDIIEGLNQSLGLACRSNSSLDELRTSLTTYFDDLIQGNFNKLVSILYRLDISEKKLRLLLQDHPGEKAGYLIAWLVIERQLEKIKTRQQFPRQRENNIDETEKW